MMQTDLTRMSATDLTRAIREGRVSAVEAVQASLDAIARDDGDLHAFITVCPEAALARAAELDAEMSRGKPAGPLQGVPVGIKDLVATKGIRTTRGSARYLHDVPAFDDLVVARLKAAGAVIVGKTNTPEFGFGALCRNDIAGNTANPFAPGHSSGGSSGGSAAAVAAGMIPIAHGSDFGGSVRTPASFCNIVGYRPGAGLFPRVPKPLPWDTLLSHGILARDIADTALMASVMSGGDPRDPASIHAAPLAMPDWDAIDPASIRIAVSKDLGIAEIDRSVIGVLMDAVEAIGRICPDITERTPDFTGAKTTFETLRAALLYHDLGPLLDRTDPPLSETVRWNVQQGREISSRDYIAAETRRGAIYANCAAFFETADILVIPSASVPPFPLDQENVATINGKPTANIIDYLAITYAISLVGLPAVSIPAGFTSEGLPVGIQLVGRPGGDRDLLTFAALLEREPGFRHCFPTT